MFSPFFFFFNDTATTEIYTYLYTLSLHYALPICLILPTAGNTTILVVDDNEDLVALFQRYLGGHRINVLGATVGAEAVALAIKHLPHAILVDVMMPHQDGWDVLQGDRKSTRLNSSH